MDADICTVLFIFRRSSGVAFLYHLLVRFAPPSGHRCVCQRTLGGGNEDSNIHADYFDPARAGSRLPENLIRQETAIPDVWVPYISLFL